MADAIDIRYMPANGPPRMVSFRPRSDSGWFRVTLEWTGCQWRETGCERVDAVALERIPDDDVDQAATLAARLQLTPKFDDAGAEARAAVHNPLTGWPSLGCQRYRAWDQTVEEWIETNPSRYGGQAMTLAIVEAVRSFGRTTGDAGDAPDTVATEPRELFHVLKNERRFETVRHFLADIGEDEVVTSGELACYLAHLEHGEDYTSDERKGVYIALIQNHLDQLTEARLLEKVGRHDYRAGPALEAAGKIIETADDVTGGESS